MFSEQIEEIVGMIRKMWMESDRIWIENSATWGMDGHESLDMAYKRIFKEKVWDDGIIKADCIGGTYHVYSNGFIIISGYVSEIRKVRNV